LNFDAPPPEKATLLRKALQKDQAVLNVSAEPVEIASCPSQLLAANRDVLHVPAAYKSQKMDPRAFSPPYPIPTLTKSPPMTKSNLHLQIIRTYVALCFRIFATKSV
jgi:hypothetical protein